MRKENINKIKFTIFIVFIVCILVFVLLNWNTIKHLKIHKLLKYLEGIGPVAMVVYFGFRGRNCIWSNKGIFIDYGWIFFIWHSGFLYF